MFEGGYFFNWLGILNNQKSVRIGSVEYTEQEALSL